MLPARSLRVSVLFSEPKIPQCTLVMPLLLIPTEFQCSSASRKFLNTSRAIARPGNISKFQCSSASRKFLNHPSPHSTRVQFAFQCSSASRKFLKPKSTSASATQIPGFSALQRAENSSNCCPKTTRTTTRRFQCSSASRKFLKWHAAGAEGTAGLRFQCSSASRKFLKLFFDRESKRIGGVSVLFSEPKIPQNGRDSVGFPVYLCFSALQRAENSSNESGDRRCAARRVAFQCSSASRKFLKSAKMFLSIASRKFQCSSASRKFLKSAKLDSRRTEALVSVLFSEPKIPQIRPSHLRPSIFPTATITLRRS